jgi:hypothetical protein
MPTPDASQFTQLKKFRAASLIGAEKQGQNRTVTRTTQLLPFVSNPIDFLPSFTNKFVEPAVFVRRNTVTGVQVKPRIPRGNICSP